MLAWVRPIRAGTLRHKVVGRGGEKWNSDSVEDVLDLRGHLSTQELRGEDGLCGQCVDYCVPLSVIQGS